MSLGTGPPCCGQGRGRGNPCVLKSTKWTRLWLVVIAAFSVSASFVSLPADAITNGMLDTDHAYVGAVIADEPSKAGTDVAWCSGALVSPRVFLTAGHCTRWLESTGLPIDRMWVSFAPNILADRKSWRAISAYGTHPEYDAPTADPDENIIGWAPRIDVGIVVLAKPVRDIAPGRLAPDGFLAQLDAAARLLHETFAIVGYGLNENFMATGDRRIASAGYLPPLDSSWLALSRDAPGEGGGCFMDSGGPTLLAVDGTEYVVAIHSIVLNSVCEGPFYDFRVDTAVSQGFILEAIARNA